MRAAIYFAPPSGSPLAEASAEWLGRDPFTGAASRAADMGVDPWVGEPARYGFHATLKAPFRLAEGRDLAELADALADFAGACAPVSLPALEVTLMPGGYIALVTSRPCPELDRLAAETVRRFEPFRAPMTDDEYRRRSPERLTPRQRDHLATYGYPHVMEEFRFHMTLTDRLGPESAPTLAHLRRRFAPTLVAPIAVDALSMFIEPYPGAPFTVAARCPLRARANLTETVA